MRAIGVEEAATVGTEHLNGFLRCCRPLRNALRRHSLGRRLAICSRSGDSLGLHQLRLVVGAEVLDYALRHQKQRIDKTAWQQNPKGGARCIYPEIAERLRLPPRDAPNQRDCQRYSDCPRKEVMVGQSEHLRQIAHRRRRRIGLPVCVCRERRGSIQSQIRSHGHQMLRIERQNMLKPLDQIRHDHGDQAENQHRKAILSPRPLGAFVDPRDSINKSFNRTEDAICPGSFPLKYARHIHAKGLRADEHQGEKKENLKPAVRCHDDYFLLKLLGAQQRIHQINEQQDSYQAKQSCLDHPCFSFAPSRSQPIVYPIATMKNSTLAAIHPTSHIACLPDRADFACKSQRSSCSISATYSSRPPLLNQSIDKECIEMP